MKFCSFYVLCGYIVIHAADTGIGLLPSRFKAMTVLQRYPTGSQKIPSFGISVDNVVQKNELKELKNMVYVSLGSDIPAEVPIFWLYHLVAHPDLEEQKRISLKNELKRRYEPFQKAEKQKQDKQKFFDWLLAQEHMPIIEKHSRRFSALFELSRCGDRGAMYALAGKTKRKNIPLLVSMYWYYKLSKQDDMHGLFSSAILEELYTDIHAYAQEVLKDPEKQKLYPDFFKKD